MFQRKHSTVYESLSANPTTPTKAAEQGSIDKFVMAPKKYGPADRRQQQITDALVMFVAGDLIPFSVVDSPYFRSLLSTADPRFQMPSRKHLVSKLLREKCASLQADVKQRLKSAQSVCVTLDIWSSRQMRSYLGISAHYINDWTMNTVVLACKRFHGRHTADNILQEYEETIAWFDLTAKISLLPPWIYIAYTSTS